MSKPNFPIEMPFPLSISLARMLHDSIKPDAPEPVLEFRRKLKSFAYNTCDRCNYRNRDYDQKEIAICNHPLKNQHAGSPMIILNCPWFRPDPEKILEGETIHYNIRFSGRRIMNESGLITEE